MRVKLTPDETQGITNPAKDVAPDLFVGHYGYEIVEKNKEEVDSSFPSFRLHYVIKGSVTLFFEGKKVSLKKNSVFVLMPNTGISYKADYKSSQQTELYWVTFNGYKAKHYLKRIGLTDEHPFAVLPDATIKAYFYDTFLPREHSPSMLNLVLQRNLLNIFDYLYTHNLAQNDKESALQPEVVHNQTYIQKVLYYINKHLAEPDLSINLFAKKLNVHPSTLSRLFKKEMSICFTEYITLKRMESAVSLLREVKLKVNEVARMVGFEDALYFSRLYKKRFHCSPMDTVRDAKKKNKAESTKNEK